MIGGVRVHAVIVVLFDPQLVGEPRVVVPVDLGDHGARWRVGDEPFVSGVAVLVRVERYPDLGARFSDGRWKTDVAATLTLSEVIEGLADATKITDGKVIITP